MSGGQIFKKILAVMSEIEAIGKDRRNEQQRFNFRGIDDVYNQLHPKLAKHGVFTAPEVLEERREERQTKSGGVMTYVILRMKFTFFAEDGSNVSVVVVGEGADSGDKASNKAMAIAHKYALIQVFAIPTEGDNDPDSQSPEFKPQIVSPEKAPSSEKQDVFRFGGGKYKGLTLEQAIEQDGLPAVQNYANWLKQDSEKKNQPLSHGATRFRVELERFVNRTRDRLNPQPPTNWQDEEFS